VIFEQPFQILLYTTQELIPPNPKRCLKCNQAAFPAVDLDQRFRTTSDLAAQRVHRFSRSGCFAPIAMKTGPTTPRSRT
jgi:hypothetical protein